MSVVVRAMCYQKIIALTIRSRTFAVSVEKAVTTTDSIENKYNFTCRLRDVRADSPHAQRADYALLRHLIST